MKILSVKRKKQLNAVMAIFGLAVLAFLIIRVFRSGVKSAGEFARVAGAEFKELFRTNYMVVFLSLVCLGLDFIFGVSDFSMAVLLGTLTTGAGVVTVFNTTYVPKYFFYTAGTQLQGVKITVQGDGVIFDSDAAGLTHVGTNRLFGQITNGFFFRIANGFIPNKNVIWEFTNSAAQTPQVFVSSDEQPVVGAMYLQLLRQAILANSGINFNDFATLSMPSLSANDTVNVLYSDGTQQQLNRVDIQAMLQLTQNVVNTPIYLIDNFAGRIKLVNVITGAAQTAYVQRWVPVIGGGMVNQSVVNP